MARFYQNLDAVNKDKFGTVVRLLRIDDVTDDEMMLMYFDDGSKINIEFVAEYDDINAFKKHMPFVELTSKDNVWKIEKHESLVSANDGIFGRTMDGEVCEAANPDLYRGINGAEATGKRDSIRTEVYPPIIRKNIKLEPLDGYYMSNGCRNGLEDEEHSEVIEKTEPYVEEIKTIEYKASCETVVGENNDFMDISLNTDVCDAQCFNGIKVDTNAASIINTDTMHLSLEEDGVDFVEFLFDGEKIKYSYKEFVSNIKDYILGKKILIDEETLNKYKKNEIEENDNEDVLIKNMIDKSKKVESSIDMSIDLELPPIEVYNTIKAVYPEGMTTEFVNSLTSRISHDTLREALAIGLKEFYDNE